MLSATDASPTLLPYDSDEEYLFAAWEVVLARARLAQALINDGDEPRGRRGRRSCRPAPQPLQLVEDEGGCASEEVRRFRGEVDLLTRTLEQRAALSRAAGCLPSVERLAELHDLDEVERMILVATTMVALGDRYAEQLSSALPAARCGGVYPEMVALLFDMGLVERASLRRRLGPGGRLRRSGLVELDQSYNSRVADFWSTEITLREGSLELVLPTGE